MCNNVFIVFPITGRCRPRRHLRRGCSLLLRRAAHRLRQQRGLRGALRLVDQYFLETLNIFNYGGIMMTDTRTADCS